MLGILDTLLYPGNFQHKLTLKKNTPHNLKSEW